MRPNVTAYSPILPIPRIHRERVFMPCDERVFRDLEFPAVWKFQFIRVNKNVNRVRFSLVNLVEFSHGDYGELCVE